MPLYFEDLMMVVNKDGFETNRRGVLWTETAMEINIPSITLLSRKRSGGEKSQPNKRVQGQGAFYFSSGAHVSGLCCVYTWSSLSFVGVPRPVVGEASDSSAVRKKRTCHMADVHSGRSRQPSPVVVSVLFTCAAAAGGGGGGR